MNEYEEEEEEKRCFGHKKNVFILNDSIYIINETKFPSKIGSCCLFAHFFNDINTISESVHAFMRTIISLMRRLRIPMIILIKS